MLGEVTSRRLADAELTAAGRRAIASRHFRLRPRRPHPWQESRAALGVYALVTAAQDSFEQLVGTTNAAAEAARSAYVSDRRPPQRARG
jgi:hypothetical protein